VITYFTACEAFGREVRQNRTGIHTNNCDLNFTAKRKENVCQFENSNNEEYNIGNMAPEIRHSSIVCSCGVAAYGPLDATQITSHISRLRGLPESSVGPHIVTVTDANGKSQTERITRPSKQTIIEED